MPGIFESGKMEQELRFCAAPDSTRLAYARVGQGPALVKLANWLGHLEYDWVSPIWRPWLEEWARFRTLYRYDQRGCGLSDWDASDFSFDALVSDLEAVVDAAGLEQFDLLGMSQGGSVAIAYTARHPERVSRLVIDGGYIRGQLRRDPSREAVETAEVELKLLELGWGTENPAYRQVFTTFLIPEGTPEQFAWFNELQRVSTSGENAMKLQGTFNEVDVRELAKTVKTPTLVIHSRNDAAVPFEEGRLTATLIPGARFVSLESKNHILLATEPAWPHYWDEFYRFLGIEAGALRRGQAAVPSSPGDALFLALTAREREILRLIANGRNNAEISRILVLSPKTVRNYISNIYAKLQINSRGEAIVLARKSGLVDDKA